MNILNLLLVIISALVPVGFVLGFFVAVKTDITELKTSMKFLNQKVDRLETKIDCIT